uniref:Hydantoinase A/oxoprolinase domain-containing protein n=1 Tax=Ignisphaera aggregans TaxID=334771 RepID=A0A7C2V9M9_9CREN
MTEIETVVGLDIGGANIKAVKITHRLDGMSIEDVIREYTPLWIVGVEGLREKISNIKKRLGVGSSPYLVGVCMTAELSDVFFSKAEGVNRVVDVVEEVFADAAEIFYVNYNAELVTASRARSNPIEIAAANWAASAWILENVVTRLGLENAVFIDIGSTSTTIIPLVNGKATVRGRTDPEKLLFGELVYVGTLRTDVSSLIDKAPYKGFYVGICRERFSLVGDAQLILGYIRPEDYTSDTADGRGKSVAEALARLARVVCADSSMISLAEGKEIARYIYEKQVFKVFEALIQIRSWISSKGIDLDGFAAIIAGTGKHIAFEAARRAGFERIVDIDHVLGKPLASVIPAYGAALMVLSWNENAGSS